MRCGMRKDLVFEVLAHYRKAKKIITKFTDSTFMCGLPDLKQVLCSWVCVCVGGEGLDYMGSFKEIIFLFLKDTVNIIGVFLLVPISSSFPGWNPLLRPSWSGSHRDLLISPYLVLGLKTFTVITPGQFSFVLIFSFNNFPLHLW